MLVLSRKPGESLLIGDNIYVKIVSVDGDKVRVAIDAPKNVNIMRNELTEAEKINNQAVKKVSNESLSKLRNVLKKKKHSE